MLSDCLTWVGPRVLGFLPETVLLFGAFALLLLGTFSKASRGFMVALFTAVLGLCVAALWVQFHGFLTHGPYILFRGLWHAGLVSSYAKTILLLTAWVVAIWTFDVSEIKKSRLGETLAMLLVLLFGLHMMVSTKHYLVMFLGMETVSILSYWMVAGSKTSKLNTEAAVKYLVFGGVAASFMLLGMAFVYGLTGKLTTDALHEAWNITYLHKGNLKGYFLIIYLSVLAGMGFKAAIFPSQMWCPDVYQGAPTPVTLFLSVAPKLAGFVLLARFLEPLLAHSQAWTLMDPELPLRNIWMLFSILTMSIANFAALCQSNIKRLMAYSSISHAGFLMMGIAAGTLQGFSAFFLYFPIYALMNLVAFTCIHWLEQVSGRVDIDAYAGLGKKHPYVSATLVLAVFSLVGLPPFAGFTGKFHLFAAAFHQELYVLLLFGALNTAVALVYYARIAKKMFLEEPAPANDGAADAFFRVHWARACVLAALTAPLLFWGLFWDKLYRFSQFVASTLFYS